MEHELLFMQFGQKSTFSTVLLDKNKEKRTSLKAKNAIANKIVLLNTHPCIQCLRSAIKPDAKEVWRMRCDSTQFPEYTA